MEVDRLVNQHGLTHVLGELTTLVWRLAKLREGNEALPADWAAVQALTTLGSTLMWAVEQSEALDQHIGRATT